MDSLKSVDQRTLIEHITVDDFCRGSGLMGKAVWVSGYTPDGCSGNLVLAQQATADVSGRPCD
jgi:hypothetical protein